jgi:hypothetical protein
MITTPHILTAEQRWICTVSNIGWSATSARPLLGSCPRRTEHDVHSLHDTVAHERKVGPLSRSGWPADFRWCGWGTCPLRRYVTNARVLSRARGLLLARAWRSEVPAVRYTSRPHCRGHGSHHGLSAPAHSGRQACGRIMDT